MSFPLQPTSKERGGGGLFPPPLSGRQPLSGLISHDERVRIDTGIYVSRNAARIPHDIIEALIEFGSIPEFRRMLSICLREASDKAFRELINAASRYPPAGVVVAHALLDVGDRACRVLADLDAFDPPARCIAMLVLGWARYSGVSVKLVRQLRDPDPDVRRVAAWALGQIRNEWTVPALVGVLRKDPSREVRTSAAMALRNFSCRRASLALLRAALDPDPEIREVAGAVLGGSQE